MENWIRETRDQIKNGIFHKNAKEEERVKKLK
jgi:hypothetical protein